MNPRPSLPPGRSSYDISRLHLPAPARLLASGTYRTVTRDKSHWYVL